MAVLVTGATGFVGRNVVELLLSQGERVHVLCRQDPRQPGVFPAGWTFNGSLKAFQGNILDARTLTRAMEGCDRVLHIAAHARQWARDDRVFFDVNVGGVRNVLSAALTSSVQRVVVTSSSVTFGPSRGRPVDESSEREVPPFTPYEESKCRAERETLTFIDKGLDVVIVNPTRVFGPGLLSEGNSATRMIALFVQGNWHVVPADGNAVGNYCYVKDIARGHLLAMRYGRCGQKYVLGGENLTYNELFALVADLAERHHVLFHVPESVSLLAARIEEIRAKLSNHQPRITRGWARTFLKDWAFSSAKAEHELGYRITPIAQAIGATLRWIRSITLLNGNDRKP